MVRTVRHAIVRVTRPLRLPIRSGPLRGLRWSIGTGLRFLRGTYEQPKAEALVKLVGVGDIVCDVGAHMGYFTAIASLQAGPTGRVHAFEPRPLNFSMLQGHIRANALDNVVAVQAAVGERPGEGRFDRQTGTGTGHLSQRGDLVVRVVSLDDLYSSGALPRIDVLKVDVEGGETAVLAGAMRVLEELRPRLILATHGQSTHEHCLSVLKSLGYTHRILPDTGHAGETELVALPTRKSPTRQADPW
jgi:FkbM family methyltransferase